MIKFIDYSAIAIHRQLSARFWAFMCFLVLTKSHKAWILVYIALTAIMIVSDVSQQYKEERSESKKVSNELSELFNKEG